MYPSLETIRPLAIPIRQSAPAHRFRVPYLRWELRADVPWQSRQKLVLIRNSRARTTHSQQILEFSGSIGPVLTILHLLIQRLTRVRRFRRAIGISPLL